MYNMYAIYVMLHIYFIVQTKSSAVENMCYVLCIGIYAKRHCIGLSTWGISFSENC